MPFDRKEYQRNYQREWVKRRKAAWFAGKECRQCGSTESLELDHIDPETKTRPTDHHIWSWSDDRRDAELAKCQILCRFCHKAKSNAENSVRQKRDSNLKFVNPANLRRSCHKLERVGTHGLHAYWAGCRCPECRAAVYEMRYGNQRKVA